MKTALAVLAVIGFLQTAICQGVNKEVTNSTNTVSTLAMFRKATLFELSPKLSFDASALLSERPIIVVFPKIGTNRLFTIKPFQWDAPPPSIAEDEWGKEKEARLLIPPVGKEVMPHLYYLHLDRMSGSDEQSDLFGKEWKLSPLSKTKFVFPLIKWDFPSAREIGERVTFGFGFSWKFP